MRCEDALAAISLLADGELSGGAPAEADLDAHVAGCAACADFATTVRHIRSRLRVEPIDQAPDLGPAVVAALRAEGHGGDGHGRRAVADGTILASDGEAPTVDLPREAPLGHGPIGPTRPTHGIPVSRQRHGGRRVAVAAAVAALAGMAAGATFVGLGTEPRSPAAADVPALVVAAQHDIDTVDSRFTVTEPASGADGSGPGEEIERTFDGRLVYRAPESLALSVHETTSGLGVTDPAEGRLVVDGDSDRWWHETARRCSDAAGRVRCPDEPVTWVRSVTGRVPFSAASPVPLDLVGPVDSFTLSATPPSLGERVIAGHRAIGVQVSAAQVAPLVDGLAATVDLGPVHPADRVDLWLDEQHLVPLVLAVRAADDPARAQWASTVGATAAPGEVVLTMTTTDVRINGQVDDDALRVPPADAAGTGHLDASDAGFRPTAPDDPAVADVPVPQDLPVGFAVHRSGTLTTPGGPPVGIRSWSDGRAWLTVRATTAWAGGRLFGDLGPDVRPVDLGAAGTAYANSDGGRVGLHADGLDVVVAGSLPPGRLQDVAADLGIVGLAVPDEWDEAATADLAGAATAVPGLLTARGLDGFGDPAVRLVRSDGATTATQVFAGAGQRAFTLTQRPGGLPPPSAGDEAGVEVRGTPGRYSPRGGEVAWVEHGHVLSLRSDTLTLGDLVDIAGRLEPVS